MRNLAGRLAILCVLLASGALAVYHAWATAEHLQQLDRERQLKASTIDRLLTSISAIAAAQQAYVDFGRRDQRTLTQVSLLVDHMTTDAAGLRAAGGTANSTARLEEFWTALSALMTAESHARETLAAGDEGAAADALFVEAKDQVETLRASLRGFLQSETESYASTRTDSNRRRWIVLGGVAVLWAAGLIVFAAVPGRRRSDLPEVGRVVLPADAIVSLSEVVGPAANADSAPSAPVSNADLKAAATCVSNLARLEDAAALPGLLEQIAVILNARGVILWMAAGDELIVAAAHGYDAHILRRIRPIGRMADNVTAAAWRTSELQTVPPEETGYGALVAPMVGPSGPLGVLAAEIAGGHESDPDTRSLAAIIASQFASVLAGWPAAHSAGGQDDARGVALDRQAAAS